MQRRQFIKGASMLMAAGAIAPLAQANINSQVSASTAAFTSGKYRILALVFDDYETLDLHGPVEMLGHMPNTEIKLVAATEIVRSYQGPRVVADCLTTNTYDCDLLLIPGGMGTRTLINDLPLRQWLIEQVGRSQNVFTVCTGTALLAMTSVLNGRKATTNKMAFQWVTSLNANPQWQAKARWVFDGKFLTSSGVSAGTDAALFWVKHLHGAAEAQRIQTLTEYDWNADPLNDPYAAA
ncbi:DJ-1/PfpI family protein [Shewanella fidelis]|uniref:DJ-1/PfpI family protein n=1 Tax=Shewanella fidelis TaxID=173509 RepID=A0AAW8NUW1_9GAMM|nr:DJ-1/PfpI family protein [Shewanella fidelis]MDR8525694.1 DJ-1/PfpI family protein [Shewanella fidelis]MDW4812797.1 DJ-1/PfpI family protein [Shewanella fidelis]MDW4816545.1 DJ-1/PfpI family protein [Shewanella fidelis]MDW4820291.1 DJ-1/PfpI family protein [Shewanella fidelis]MDW4825261.1 DJ-1/PfpI family protein [Shewanella fidelis]